MAIQQIQHGHGATIYPSDTENISEYLQVYGRSTCLYVGTGGNLRVLTVGGDDVTFRNVQSGQFIPVMVTKVFLTGTTASNITVVDMGPGRFRGLLFDYSKRVSFDGGVVEAGACVDAVNNLLLNASLLLIPSGYKGGKLYSQIPTNGNGDLTWTRASTAIRTNSSGLLESMATGVPRLSYMYGSCPSVLLEPQRTNLFLQSETFDGASWVKSNTSYQSNTTTSPDGNTNAYTISIGVDASAVRHRTYQGFTATIGTTYTGTYYLKANEHQWIQIVAVSGFSTGVWANFDLSNGTIGNTGGTDTTASIQNVGNGWYRCRVSGVATGTSSTGFEILVINNTNSGRYPSYQSSVAEDVCYVYGAQLEAGAYPTTYIPTTSATATRVADSFSRNNIYTNGLISASGGTWFVEFRGNVAYTRDSIGGVWIGDNTTSGTLGNTLVIRNGGPDRLSIGKTILGTFTSLYTTTTNTTKIAIKWNGSTADIFANGTKVVSATSFTPTNMENLVGNANDVPKFIQQMALSPTPLSDTDCQLLTAL